MGLFSSSKSASKPSGTPGYIILNLVRFCNIVCLLSCLASSAVMLVKTFVVSKFFFFDATSHLFTGLLAIFLTITETPLFRKYFQHNWPLLSISSGFVTLGVFMLFLGTLILGNLNKEATSEDSLGTSFWQLLIASGIITCIFGLVNIVVNFIFRKRSLNITARMVRTYGASASLHVTDVYAAGPPLRAANMHNEWHEKTVMQAPSSQPSYENMRSYEPSQPPPLPPQSQPQLQQPTGAITAANLADPSGMMQRAPSVAPSSAPSALSAPSYYGNTNTRSLHKNPSVVFGELGGPYARSVSPLSRASTHNTNTTRWPTVAGARRSISTPIAYDQEQFKKFHNAHEIPRPADTAHPALRGDWV